VSKMAESRIYKSLPLVLAISIAVVISYLMISSITGYTIQASIYIDVEGVPKIVLNGTLERDIEEIQLPSEPTPASLVLYIDGDVRTPVLINNTVVVTGEPGSRFEIIYIPRVDVGGDGISFRYYSDYESTLTLSNNIVLLSLPENILESGYVGDNYIIRFIGFYEIRYVVSSEPAGQPDGGNQTSLPFLEVALIVSIATAISVVIILWYRMRRGGEDTELEEPGFIDETDRMILDELDRMGGEAYQSELVKRLGIPKTTLWRHIRRLEILGYIKVVKEFRRNRVVLLKKP